MDSPLSHHPSKADSSSLSDKIEVLDNDTGLENLESDQAAEIPYPPKIRIPPRNQACPSPSGSLSTTVSEIELEHGELLLKVKRLPVKEEEVNAVGLIPEDISSD